MEGWRERGGGGGEDGGGEQSGGRGEEGGVGQGLAHQEDGAREGGQGEGRVSPGRKGQLKQVKCRVCEEQMNRQSYKVHLKLKHGLDTNDLREFGQNTMFGIKRKVAEIQSEVTITNWR